MPPRKLDLADNRTLMYLGRGWQIEPRADEGGERGRYLKGAASEIYVPPSAADTFTLRVFSPDDSQRLVLEWNGMPLPEQTLRAGWADYDYRIPPQFLRAPGLQLLELRQSAPPHTFAINSLELK